MLETIDALSCNYREDDRTEYQNRRKCSCSLTSLRVACPLVSTETRGAPGNFGSPVWDARKKLQTFICGRVSSNFLRLVESRRAPSKNVEARRERERETAKAKKEKKKEKNGESMEDGTRVVRTSLADMTDTLFAFNYRVPCERNISRELFPPLLSLLRYTPCPRCRPNTLWPLVSCLFADLLRQWEGGGEKNFRQIAVFAMYLERDSLVDPRPSFIKLLRDVQAN